MWWLQDRGGDDVDRPADTASSSASSTPTSASSTGSDEGLPYVDLADLPPEAAETVQLIDAGSFWQKMRKSLGSKRKELSDAHIERITRLFGDFAEAEQDGIPISRIFDNEAFGYHAITVERPLRDEAGNVVLGIKGKQKGKPQPDASLRDTENVPYTEDVSEYFKREVLPHAPDAWIDPDKTKVGYEIPFNRHFYVFEPPRSLHAIDEELKAVTTSIMKMLGELAE